MTLRHAITVVSALVISLTLAVVTPAQAHHGYTGPVRLYLETVRLETEGQDWHIRAGVNDSGSGQPAPGFVVDASGSGPEGATFGPVHLSDTDADGHYEADLGPQPPGDWSVTVSVTDVPGSDERAFPISRTWSLAVPPGASLELVGRGTTLDDSAASSSSSGPGPLAPALVIASLAVVAGLSATWLRRRRSPAVPTVTSVRSARS